MSLPATSSTSHQLEQHPDSAVTRYSYFPPTPEAMSSIVEELFVGNWQDVVVGPCIEGTVFEVRFERAPEVVPSDLAAAAGAPWDASGPA